jgi:hypothetical protein
MVSSKKYWTVVAFVLGLMMLTTMAVTAGTPEPKIYGKTYGEWSAKWWKWVKSIPAQSNPLLSSAMVSLAILHQSPFLLTLIFVLAISVVPLTEFRLCFLLLRPLGLNHPLSA